MHPARKALIGAAMVGAAFTGGAVGASFMGSAHADTSTTTAPAAGSTATTAAPAPSGSGSSTAPQGGRHAGGSGGGGGPHTANGITETPLTGDDLAKATAAANAAVPGGTIERAETDAEGAKYEVHMTKADGSEVTVKLDANFKVTGTVDGRG